MCCDERLELSWYVIVFRNVISFQSVIKCDRFEQYFSCGFLVVSLMAFSSTVHIVERIKFRESVCHKARRKYFASERRIWQKIARKLFVIVTSRESWLITDRRAAGV